MNRDVFELVEITNEEVILKVKEVDNLTIARNPYINKEMDYITVTRGKNHTLTVIKKDGTTWSVSWGESGYTLVSKSVEKLEDEVKAFIRNCGICLGICSRIRNIKVFYNRNFGKWQITVEDIKGNNDYIHTGYDEDGTKDLVEKYTGMKVFGWREYTAPTGIIVSEALFTC